MKSNSCEGDIVTGHNYYEEPYGFTFHIGNGRGTHLVAKLAGSHHPAKELLAHQCRAGKHSPGWKSRCQASQLALLTSPTPTLWLQLSCRRNHMAPPIASIQRLQLPQDWWPLQLKGSARFAVLQYRWRLRQHQQLLAALEDVGSATTSPAAAACGVAEHPAVAALEQAPPGLLLQRYQRQLLLLVAAHVPRD